MKKLIFTLLLTISIYNPSQAEHDGKVQILLVGDSTTECGIPKVTNPEGPHLEQIIEQLLAIEPDLPKVKVYNLGQGGDTAYRVLNSGRYDKQIANIPGADYIFVRYGINDWHKRQPIKENFPDDMRKLIARLRQDHPKALIIPMTIIPFMKKEQSIEINDMLREIAASEKLDLFDIYPAYAKALETAPNSLNYRRYPLMNIPEKYHEWLKPYTFPDRNQVNKVQVMDNRLDAHFGHLPNWYGDRHPNLAGYHLIGSETVKYLTPILRARAGKQSDPVTSSSPAQAKPQP